jgi:hypothetical protein
MDTLDSSVQSGQLRLKPVTALPLSIPVSDQARRLLVVVFLHADEQGAGHEHGHQGKHPDRAVLHKHGSDRIHVTFQLAEE